MAGTLYRCSRCPRTTSEPDEQWEVRDVPTIGGGVLHLGLCYTCRLTGPQAGEDHPFSLCRGDHTGEGWEASCRNPECDFRHRCWQEECANFAADQHADEDIECPTCGGEWIHHPVVRERPGKLHHDVAAL